MKFDTFFELLIHWVQLTPNAPALIFEKGNSKQTLTYLQLKNAVEQRSRCFADNMSLGIVCDGSKENIIEIFAAAKAGVQVTLLDSNLKQEQLNSADVNSLFADEDTKEEFQINQNAQPHSPGKILFFTSGTTQSNKAVVLSQQSLLASAFNGASLLPLEKADTLLCMLPLSHVFGFVCGLLWGLQCGASVALGRGARHYFDDLQFFEPTVLSAVPLLLGFLQKNNLFNNELKLVLIGAGGCNRALIDAVKSRGIRVSFGYGLTETSSGVALSTGDDPYCMSICPEMKVQIADDGEILITAPTCVMQGYYKNEKATAEVLKDGMLHSGDIGKIENGKLFITGRKKEIITLANGSKIFIPEYEQKLAKVLENIDFIVAERNGEICLIINNMNEDEAWQKIAPVMKTTPLGQRIKTIISVPFAFERTQTGKIKRWSVQQRAGIK